MKGYEMNNKQKKTQVTVGEVIEMLSKANWKNKIYCNSDKDSEPKENYVITGISQHSGGVVTINFE